MAYLLDTCVALWFFEGSQRIPDRVREALTDPSQDVMLSDVSVLEIVIKHQIGKLRLDAPPSRIILPLARKHGMEILPLTTADILALERLADFHRDPFDRLLIAQAITRRFTLVTPDPLIRQYPIDSLWD